MSLAIWSTSYPCSARVRIPVPRSPWMVGWSASSMSQSYFLTWAPTHSFQRRQMTRPSGVSASHRPQRSRSGHLQPVEVHALAFSPIEKMSVVLIIPSIMLRRGQKWNGGYKLIVRLGATANKKKRSCPRFLIVEFFGVRGNARSPL
jgi:hypothetical protein